LIEARIDKNPAADLLFVTFTRRIAMTLATVTTTLGAEGPSRRGLPVQPKATVAPGNQAPGTRQRTGVLGWALWTLAMLGLIPIVWFDQLLRHAGRPDLVQLNTSGIPFVVAMLSASTVGAVLVSRRPRHPVGWLLLILGLSVTVDGVASGYAGYGALARPGALPATREVAVYASTGTLVARGCIGFVLLLTPTGSLPSPRWRWWARLAAVVPVLFLASRAMLPRPLSPPFQSVPSPFAVPALAGPLLTIRAVTGILLGLTVVVAAASLVVRFRRARGTERLQLRWVVVAAALSATVAVVLLIASVLENAVVLVWMGGVYVAALPLAIGAAVLRYRLYDLDRIIRRTLGYGLLTVLLGGGYAGVVLGLGQLVGQNSSLLVAGATLTVAALFQPARRRVQDLVDRRFNRRRYDAALTIQAFSARLRQQVDLDTLTAELLNMVDQTMQPTQVSLWLRPAPARQVIASSGEAGARR
jgi:hypothetical protein